MRSLAFFLILLATAATNAQPYPSRPLKVIVPFPPGSTPDIVGHTVSAKLQDALGQPVVVENRTGAGGNIGAEAVAKAPADGYTLFIGTNGPVAINKYLYRSLPFDPEGFRPHLASSVRAADADRSPRAEGRHVPCLH